MDIQELLRRYRAGERNFAGVELTDSDETREYKDTAYNGVDFRGADLSGINLSGVSLRKAVLSFSTLNGADLSGADLSGALLEAAEMINTNFSGAFRDLALFRAERYSFLSARLRGSETR
jgi:uncharacterized protein YjbI with pentapeptide repeats